MLPFSSAFSEAPTLSAATGSLGSSGHVGASSVKLGSLTTSNANDEQAAARALKVAYRTALGVIRDAEAASDVAQDVVIKMLKRPALRDPHAFDAWVHRVAVRAAIDHSRRAEAQRRADRGYAQSVPATTDAAGSDGDFLGYLGVLPTRQRAALTLRFVHDLDDRQIARALGCRTGTVRSLLSRGMATLRDELAEQSTEKEGALDA